MNDAENLSKLLGHLPPAVFREFMVDEFGLAMPDVDAKKPKKEQREQMSLPSKPSSSLFSNFTCRSFKGVVAQRCQNRAFVRTVSSVCWAWSTAR